MAQGLQLVLKVSKHGRTVTRGFSSRTGEREGGWLRDFSLFSQYLNMGGQSQEDPPIKQGREKEAGSETSACSHSI